MARSALVSVSRKHPCTHRTHSTYSNALSGGRTDTTLDVEMKRRGTPLPTSLMLHIAHDMLHALEHAHRYARVASVVCLLIQEPARGLTTSCGTVDTAGAWSTATSRAPT
jgi:hypothetical protein